MRGDEFIREGETSKLPLPVVVQPDPMLEERPVSAARLLLTALAAGVVVVLVLYGVAQSPEQPQVAATQSDATALAEPGKQGQGKSPRADSATTGHASAPSDKAAPPAK